tara:strand:- start:491 stop:706 length:216 start_codon:yes stop_codon:yes gene_type:complete
MFVHYRGVLPAWQALTKREFATSEGFMQSTFQFARHNKAPQHQFVLKLLVAKNHHVRLKNSATGFLWLVCI